MINDENNWKEMADLDLLEVADPISHSIRNKDITI